MLNPSKYHRAWMFGLISASVVGSPIVRAESAVQKTSAGIVVDSQIEEIALQAGGKLTGVIVDSAGKPVVGTPVVIGQAGKPLAQLTTDREGKFEMAGLTDGHYQVASYAKVQNYRVFNQHAPVQAKEGIVHVMPEQVARGQEPIPGSYGPAYGNLPPANPHRPLVHAIMNPIIIGGLIAGAVAIGVAISEDDDS